MPSVTIAVNAQSLGAPRRATVTIEGAVSAEIVAVCIAACKEMVVLMGLDAHPEVRASGNEPRTLRTPN